MDHKYYLRMNAKALNYYHQIKKKSFNIRIYYNIYLVFIF